MTAKPAKWAVITGASSGIGLAIATACAQDGYSILLAGRDAEKLQEAARHIETEYHVNTLVHMCDLSSVTAAKQLYEYARRQNIGVEILVNNAGFGDYGRFETADVAVLQSMVGVNVSALTSLTRLFAPDLMKRQRAYVMNVASTAAFLPGPYMAVYYATKAYVLSLSQALAEEWRGSGVSVTALCPGPTRTGFAASSHAENTALFRGKLPTAETVAQYGYAAMLRGKPIAVHGIRNKLTTQATRLLPRSLQRRLVARVQHP